MDTLQILYAVFFGIPIIVFIIYYFIKEKSGDESIKQAYTVAIILILLGIAYLALHNPSIEEGTKNQFVYIGLMLAFMGLILTVQGDIKGTQRHRDIQKNIVQTHDQLDRIEECLKGTKDPKNNDRPKPMRDIQSQTDDPDLNEALKVALVIAGFGFGLWAAEFVIYGNFQSLLSWGLPLGIFGISAAFVIKQLKDQQRDLTTVVSRLSAIERKLEGLDKKINTNQRGIIPKIIDFIFPFWR